MNFKDKFLRFMQGRYGNDNLNRFLMILFLGSFLLSLFTRVEALNILGMLFVVLAYYRMLSRDINRRMSENEVYLKWYNKVRYFFQRQRNIMKQRKTHHIYSCPSCKQKIRIPRGKGKIAIRCPRCGAEFIKRS